MKTVEQRNREADDLLKYIREFIEREGCSPTFHEMAARFKVSTTTIGHRRLNLIERGLLEKPPRNGCRALKLKEETK